MDRDDRTVNILGLKAHKVDMDDAVCRVREMLADGQVHQVVTLNAEMAMLAQGDPALARIINCADLVVPDGVGVVWASRVLGNPLPGRVAGFDLMLELLACAERERWSVFLLGAAPGVAEEAASRLRARLPGLLVAGTHHGYLTEADDPAVVEKLNATGAQLVFVAMGAPRQDKWIARNKSSLRPSICIGVGGSFDVLAGKVSRAPRWIGNAGLEWLYRLVLQPRRIVRMMALPRFVFRVFAAKYAKRGGLRFHSDPYQ
ncbi:MAG: WecB/TagA/CpsF family glycosyltransferase [Bacillota bacterium]